MEVEASNVPIFIMLILSGYIYDIFGRRKTLFFAMFFTGCSLFLFPIGAPKLYLYVIAGCLFNLGTAAINNNPLILDYVIKEDRGKAISLSIMGISLGVIVSL